jgi:chemotaxis protein MotB
VCLKKKYADLSKKQRNSRSLNSATVKLNSCLEEKAGLTARVDGLKEYNRS